MILIRNCPHNNGTYTLKDSELGKIVKSSYSKDGMVRLLNEYNGYKWYFNRINFDDLNGVQFNETENKRYVRLLVNIFSGKNGNCHKSLSYNSLALFKVIDSYVNIWPTDKNKMTTIHGDFSLGNIIFNDTDESLLIIDWEHYNKDILPWGFDIVNLLYESVYFTLKGKSYLRKIDIEAYIKVKKYTLNLLDSLNCMDGSLQQIIDIISNNRYLWGGLANKLPVMNYSNEQTKYLDLIEQKYNLDRA